MNQNKETVKYLRRFYEKPCELDYEVDDYDNFETSSDFMVAHGFNTAPYYHLDDYYRHPQEFITLQEYTHATSPEYYLFTLGDFQGEIFVFICRGVYERKDCLNFLMDYALKRVEIEYKLKLLDDMDRAEMMGSKE